MTFFACNVALCEIIEDEVAKKSFAGQNLTKPVYQKPIIEDEVAQKSFDGKNFAKPLYGYITIEDSTMPVNAPTKQPIKPSSIEDELLKNDPKLKTCSLIRPVVAYKIIDEKHSIVKLKISPKTFISSENKLKIGDRVEMKIAQDVYRDGKLFLPKDALVSATVELISEPDWFGDPEEIELGRLLAKDTDGNPIEIEGVIRKQGANRGKWVKPLFAIGYGLPLGAPLMGFYYVKGGKTKLKPTEEFEFYYE